MNEDVKPLVSICIPAYNGENYICESINSALNQSYPAIEIIVVNDGSTDRTLELLNRYKGRIKVIDTVNRGQCAAANTAFKAATGAYIKFMDADDLISSNFINSQIKKINDRKDAIVSAAWGRFYKDDLSTFRLNKESVWRDMKPIDWLVESLWDGPNMMQCALWLIPREVLIESGLWDERLSLINDFDFFIRVLLASKDVLFADDAILYYRSGISNSLSKQKSRKANESAFLSTQLGVETIMKYENSVRTRKICADAFQLWKYQFYPNHMDLYLRSEEWIKQLGGSEYLFDAGGKTRLLSKALGWKMVKRIKNYLEF